MHGSTLQAVAKNAVNCLIAEVKGRALRRLRILLADGRDVAPQRRKIDDCHYGSPWLFMICSIMESNQRKSQAACLRLFYRSMRVERMIDDMVRSTPSSAPISSSNLSSS
ncbi:hypothetical protein DEV91_12079 [Phyllobacterium brassicacearum]|nr:hypothetical protein DEV91_12079 [Phyllobacterium brassicacearum]